MVVSCHDNFKNYIHCKRCNIGINMDNHHRLHNKYCNKCYKIELKITMKCLSYVLCDDVVDIIHDYIPVIQIDDGKIYYHLL